MKIEMHIDPLAGQLQCSKTSSAKLFSIRVDKPE